MTKPDGSRENRQRQEYGGENDKLTFDRVIESAHHIAEDLSAQKNASGKEKAGGEDYKNCSENGTEYKQHFGVHGNSPIGMGMGDSRMESRTGMSDVVLELSITDF